MFIHSVPGVIAQEYERELAPGRGSRVILVVTTDLEINPTLGTESASALQRLEGALQAHLTAHPGIDGIRVRSTDQSHYSRA